MQRPERLYLADILEAADAALGYVAGTTREAFFEDDRTRGAVTYKLIIIGEAATHISDRLRARYPDVPWSDVVGFRNIAIHAYHQVAWRVVWNTVTEDVPRLRRQIAEILEAEYPGEQP